MASTPVDSSFVDAAVVRMNFTALSVSVHFGADSFAAHRLLRFESFFVIVFLFHIFKAFSRSLK